VTLVSVDPLDLVDELDRANERLFTSVAKLPDDLAVAAPSLLPHWTRGHVLTHLARQADAMVNLFTWVHTGVETPAYASPQARAEGIAAGAGRPLAEQVADLRASSDRLMATCRETTAEEWTRHLDLPDGTQVAARLPWRRLREVEVHHVDLLTDYEPGDWPEAFAHRLLHEVAAGLTGVDLTLEVAGIGHPVLIGSGGTLVAGSAATLAAWLTGRSDGYDLTVPGGGALPTLPAWI
jgi:maleylpyruvate isomerase